MAAVNTIARYLHHILFTAAVLVALVLLNSSHRPLADEAVIVMVAQNLANGSVHRFEGPEGLREELPPGWFKQNARNPLGASVALVPFMWFARPVFLERPGYGTLEPGMVWWFLHGAGSLYAAVTAMLFRLWCLSAGWSRRRASAAAIMLVFGTTLLAYSRLLYNENLQAMLVAAIAMSAWRIGRGMPGRWQRPLMYAALIAILNTKITSFWLFAAAWVLASGWRRERIWKEGAGVFLSGLAALALLALGNYLKYGSALHHGYGGDGGGMDKFGFGTPLYVGLLGLVASPGIGILWYTPLMFLFPGGVGQLWKNDRAAAVASGLGVAVHILVFAGWWAWAGAWAWGPRFLVTVLPLAMWPVAHAVFNAFDAGSFRRWLVTALCVLSFFVQYLSVLFHYSHYMEVGLESTRSSYPGDLTADHRTREDELLLNWIPQLSPIRGHLWFLQSTVTKTGLDELPSPWADLGYAPWRTFRPHFGRFPVLDWWLAEKLEQGSSRTLLFVYTALYLLALAALFKHAMPWNRKRT